MKFIVTVLITAACIASHAAVPDALAVRAIIGEAGSESAQCQAAVGEVIRLRGSLRGIYGVNNPCVAKASQKTINRATAAWAASAVTSYSHGASKFGCDADAGYFKRIGAVIVVRIGRVNFYR